MEKKKDIFIRRVIFFEMSSRCRMSWEWTETTKHVKHNPNYREQNIIEALRRVLSNKALEEPPKFNRNEKGPGVII